MTYQLFIDDERWPVDESMVVVRSTEQAIRVIEDEGVPSFISFDHDLGGEDTSMVFLKWFVEYLMDNNQKFPEYYVHSQNPVGKKNIKGFIESFNRCFG